MTKFNDFLKGEEPQENLDDMEHLTGMYGCKTCEKYTEIAFFNQNTLEMFWYCPDDHRSSQQFG